MSLKYEFIMKIKQNRLNTRWRKLNQDNFTNIKSIIPLDKLSVGKGTYGSLDVEYYGNLNTYLQIGCFCSIARDVRFVLDGGHDFRNTSQYPFDVLYFGKKTEATTKGPIEVGDDVWIGERSLILSGVHIGQGAVIAAGSIVAKDIPPYAIFVQGRVVKYRFSADIVKKLMKFDYSKLNNDEIRQYRENFYFSPEEFIETELYKRHCR